MFGVRQAIIVSLALLLNSLSLRPINGYQNTFSSRFQVRRLPLDSGIRFPSRTEKSRISNVLKSNAAVFRHPPNAAALGDDDFLASRSRDDGNYFLKGLDKDLLVRIASWAALLGVGTALRSFLPAIMCTFYFSVIGNSIVKQMQRFFVYAAGKMARRSDASIDSAPRKPFAMLYIVLLLAAISRFCFYLFPKVLNQSQYVLQVLKSEDPYTLLTTFLTGILGADGVLRVESVLMNIAGEKGQRFAGYIADPGKPTLSLTMRFGKLLQYFITGYLNRFLVIAKTLVANSTNAVINAILGLIFSFLVVWDLPNLKKGMRSLNQSRIAPMYRELSPKLRAFGAILAQSFEVQALIALVNCILTTIGLMFLKIRGVEFFSVLTFISSFIPVAGIFIATLPPLVVALTESGFVKCVELLTMVVAVHAVESYLLYPQIYAYTLKLHPLLVLVSLTLAEHFFGILGLFLALPVTLFTTNQLLFTKERNDKKTVDPRYG